MGRVNVMLQCHEYLNSFLIISQASDRDKCDGLFECPTQMFNRCPEPIGTNWAIVELHDVSLFDSTVIHYRHSLWVNISRLKWDE